MVRLFVIACLGCRSLFVQAEDAEIADLFSKAGVTGTLLIESAKTGQRVVHNDSRAQQAFVAASTFKVFNTLIALEEGVIEGANVALSGVGSASGGGEIPCLSSPSEIGAAARIV